MKEEFFVLTAYTLNGLMSNKPITIIDGWLLANVLRLALICLNWMQIRNSFSLL
jgi:hypothetical protein